MLQGDLLERISLGAIAAVTNVPCALFLLLAARGLLLAGPPPSDTTAASAGEATLVAPPGRSGRPPLVLRRCTPGLVRYRERWWLPAADGRVDLEAKASRDVERIYLSDGSEVLMYAGDSPSEQIRIRGNRSWSISMRSREVRVLDGQHAPGIEGVDEMLVGCEGLAPNTGGESMADELGAAVVIELLHLEDRSKLRYRIPGETGWVRQVEWSNEPDSVELARVIEIPAALPRDRAAEPPSEARVTRIVRFEILAWDGEGATRRPRLIERTLTTLVEGKEPVLLARTRFEVLERRVDLTPAETARLAVPKFDVGWDATIDSTSCSARLGGREFTFAGTRYRATKPIELADLETPERLLREAACVE